MILKQTKNNFVVVALITKVITHTKSLNTNKTKPNILFTISRGSLPVEIALEILTRSLNSTLGLKKKKKLLIYLLGKVLPLCHI